MPKCIPQELLFAGLFNGRQDSRLGRREDLRRGFLEALKGGLFTHEQDSTTNTGGLQ